MYLKNLELIGFKSFAERTKLEFQPGMTAIVGPNGCGKSNIADAVRWVLGEQSAKALRGSNMEDCIFNGTESYKPLSMAEVSMTLADCEAALGTEYHEVTVTRRVYRNNEGEYFINKTPCRLKDIQRLFMDTGVGTNSYSLMEQGRIDLILSSRPEDRREVFEEASGITKFKADKKEAIRKLEHTEANLLRLADIIREVRRQILSLQRQAGKARRYKSLQEQLRGLDVFATRERLNALNQEINTLEARLASVSEQEEALRADVEQTEQQAARTRVELAATEKEIADAMEASVQTKTELDRARELIRINQDRIQELRDVSARDTHDSDEAKTRLAQHRTSLDELQAQVEKAVAARDAAERDLADRTAHLVKQEQDVAKARQLLHDFGAESVDLESRAAKLQNEIYGLEAQERTSVIRRERLAAEQSGLQHAVETFESRQSEMVRRLQSLRDEVAAQAGEVAGLAGQREGKTQALAELQKTMSDLKARIAARQAQTELLSSSEAEAEGFPGGAKWLLDSARAAVVGSLAEHIKFEPAYRAAVEAVLRAWLDAVIVSDTAAALDLLRELEQRSEGSARVVTLDQAGPAAAFVEGPGARLADHVSCADQVRPLVSRLLHNVRVVDDLAQVPQPVPPEAVFVTRNGSVVRGSGSFECWRPEAHEVNPLARQHLLAEWSRELAEFQRRSDDGERTSLALQAEAKALDEALAQARIRLEESQYKLAQREGEDHIISQEAAQARERVETVAWELGVLKEQQDSGGGQRTQIRDEMERIRARQADLRASVATKTEQVQALEHELTARAAEVTEYRVRFAERRQEADHVATRKEPLEARIKELESLIHSRAEGINSYQSRIEELQKTIHTAEGRLQPLQEQVGHHDDQLEKARRRREEIVAALAASDGGLREKRAVMDEVRTRRSQVDVEVAEQRVRRQNLIERIGSDYHITPEQMIAEPEPAWESGQRPDREALETLIAEIRARLESMGPVNLVAIEEHRELEERFAFLSQQQEDLVKAKNQLMEMIRRINKTTTEMFAQTFEQVNSNFQDMFKKLFGGGSAKLVLVDEEDILESGIEIIARPPGKKLQTVSLLSGGERTMTAVALLFSLYMVKPSPFCLLDELDAALDEANIGRFVKMLEGFLDRSQFVVITHNRQTIGAAEVLYGVTMEQSGVSKIVSVKFSYHEKTSAEVQTSPEPAVAAAPPTA
ncbi:MAG: chromosome segregation protein SMC [Verrucomicrobiota bacterium]